MVGFSKKRKSSKRRGTREHGRGKKKGRGAGLRGGKGNAGRHKHKRVHYFLLGEEWGKHGFKRPEEAVEVKTVLNVSQVDQFLPNWVESGKATKVDGGFTVNLTELGVDKLLGNGQVRTAIKVTVAEATPSAIEKVEEAGGQVESTAPGVEGA